jgi:hypothetical protein
MGGIYTLGGQPGTVLRGVSWTAWRKGGRDRHSVIARHAQIPTNPAFTP